MSEFKGVPLSKTIKMILTKVGYREWEMKEMVVRMRYTAIMYSCKLTGLTKWEYIDA